MKQHRLRHSGPYTEPADLATDLATDLPTTKSSSLDQLAAANLRALLAALPPGYRTMLSL